MRSYRYFMEKAGRRKAALIMVERTAGSQARRALAMCGLVDQTREEAVEEKGRKAIGPVGRNRW
jgi:hypothetical protein